MDWMGYSTKDLEIQRCRVALTGLVNGRASVIGLIAKCDLRDVPDSIVDLRDDMAVTRPSVLLHGRLARLRHPAAQRQRLVLDGNVAVAAQRRVLRRICQFHLDQTPAQIAREITRLRNPRHSLPVRWVLQPNQVQPPKLKTEVAEPNTAIFIGLCNQDYCRGMPK